MFSIYIYCQFFTILYILLQDQELHYSSREDQSSLLNEVLKASEADAEEERMPYEGSTKSYKKMTDRMKSGADDTRYSSVKHPLFRKFRK